ncbi:Mss4-like protein [Dendryphion nanum]|uniref:Mss4-like protein n=1 Tax=Dendryphion nanum TaxID=256645 RepID=A0A9P9ECS4_9PLEO|nr:Mss4-like protein [Dendryphion nanum]
MAQEGGCCCGNVRYNIEGEPVVKALCHCSDCKKTSGSIYSTNAVYPESRFKILKGSTKEYTVTADSGNKMTSHFCGDCGSTIWREGATFAGLKVLKIGTLDDPEALEGLKPNAELYAPSRVSWVPALENAKQADKMS